MMDWSRADVDELSPEAREYFELLLREASDLGESESPIAPRDAAESELSFAQQRLWLLARREPENPVYNVPAALGPMGSRAGGTPRSHPSDLRYEGIRMTGSRGGLEVAASGFIGDRLSHRFASSFTAAVDRRGCGKVEGLEWKE